MLIVLVIIIAQPYLSGLMHQLILKLELLLFKLYKK